MRTQPRILALIAVTVAALGLTGTATPARAPAIVIGVPGVPPAFLGVRAYVALDRGFYAKYASPSVSLEPFGTGAAAAQALEGGQIALAWLPTPIALAEIARGAPLVAIEGMDRSDWQIGSLDPSITTCSQLKGHTIGVDGVGEGRYDALVAILASCGLTIADVQTMSLPGSAVMNAQISGQLTLAVDHYDEVEQIDALGKPVTVVAKLADVQPASHYAMLVTTRSALASGRALFVKVLEADIAATRWLYAGSTRGNATKIAQITGESRSVAASAIAHFATANWWDLGSCGLPAQELAATIASEVQLGILPAQGSALTPASVTDTTLWSAAQRALG